MINKSLLICLLVALALRLTFVFIGFPRLQRQWNLREDGDGYGAISETIREGHYTDVTRGPVYPVLVVAAGSFTAVKLFQALLDTATCWLVWWLALTISGRRGRTGALFAAWLWAVYPFAIWRVAFINKEIVLAFLLASYLCVQVLALRQGNIWQWLIAGGLLGFVNLCKPTFLAWPLIILAFVYLHRISLVRLGALVLATALMVVPWTLRNYRITSGEFLPVATERGGVTTFIGNYQPTLGLWEGPGKVRWMAAVEEIKDRHAGASVVELDRAFYRAAFQEMAAHPGRAFEIFLRKCGRFWFQSAARREQVFAFLIQAAYLVLLGVGLWRRWTWNVEVMIMGTLILYVMFVHALSYADLRFSLPVMPLVCVLAAAAWKASGARA
ncbi:MAG TPA: hypothetical protein VL171_02320 [Verrucomicrobiae bacterium]|nr:hypothetical protein [Verrucomicrobiae bacterium]